jgi:hypothetical protein
VAQGERRSRYRVRWLRRLLEEDENLTVEEANVAVSQPSCGPFEEHGNERGRAAVA